MPKGRCAAVGLSRLIRAHQSACPSPLQPLVAPGGIVSVGNDWRYAEYAEGGFVPGVGISAPPPAASVAADAAAAASAPAGGTQ